MNINEEIRNAAKEARLIPGFNVFGYEDSLAVIRAAEKNYSPVLLMVNEEASNVLPLDAWGALLGKLAAHAGVPVGIHLDHCADIDKILYAVNCGFTSVMYDGSRLPLEKNIGNTARIAEYAHRRNVMVEAELGAIPYCDRGETGIRFTSAEEAGRMARSESADWLAISVGNMHRLTERKVHLDFGRIGEISAVCPLPLVLHGASGIDEKDIEAAKRTGIGKINIGTALRQTFGRALRKSLNDNPEEFDRIRLFRSVSAELEETACGLIRPLTADKGNELF